MAQVTITINSREYAIACENGQEARIMQLASLMEEKAQMLKNLSGQINENMLLAMIGILIADDLVEARKKTVLPEVQTPPVAINSEALQEIDKLLNNKLKNLKEKIKSIAKEIEVL